MVQEQVQEQNANVLVLFLLLLDVADFLRQLLQCVLVTLIRILQLCRRSISSFRGSLVQNVRTLLLLRRNLRRHLVRMVVDEMLGSSSSLS